MPNFSGPEGELSELYLSEPDILERYVGNQLWLWGFNFSGQLGDNSVTHRSSPVQTVAGGTNWKQVSCGGYAHTAAIKTDGTLWLWGDNTYGQLGDNTTTNRSSPVQTIAAGITWKQVSAGHAHTAAIKTDGTLWLWGYNFLGQLGDNTIISKSSPVQIASGGTTWKQVNSGYYHTAGIKNDGSLWLWGDNSYGQLGDNTIISKSSPVQTISGGATWKQVACNYWYTSAAIKIDGTLWTWGYGGYGELGNNSSFNYSSPIQTVAGGTNWKQIAGGKIHLAAVTYTES